MCLHSDKCVVLCHESKATSFSCSLLRDPSEYQMNYYAVAGDVIRSPLEEAMMRLETNPNLKNCRLMLTLKKEENDEKHFEFSMAFPYVRSTVNGRKFCVINHSTLGPRHRCVNASMYLLLINCIEILQLVRNFHSPILKRKLKKIFDEFSFFVGSARCLKANLKK